MTKTQLKESKIGPEYNSISYELRALAQMVKGKLGSLSSKSTAFENYSINGGNNYRNNERSQTLFEREALRAVLDELK